MPGKTHIPWDDHNLAQRQAMHPGGYASGRCGLKVPIAKMTDTGPLTCSICRKQLQQRITSAKRVGALDLAARLQAIFDAK